MFEEFLSVAEAAQKLSVSPRTIQRYCKEGRLNYKWVNGRRHKELRIVPPLSVTDLPGVQRKNVLSSLDYVTQTDFEKVTHELHRQIHLRERRIDELEQEIARLKKIVTSGSGAPGDPGQAKKFQRLFNDMDKVRPKETKLILKMAQELRKHKQYLVSLGMEDISEEEQK